MIDFDSACRICLKNDATYPIFENIEGCKSIHAQLPQCIKEKIEDIKDYPRNICIECKNTIDTLCNFLNKFEETCKILQSKIVTVKTELIDYYDINREHLYEVEILQQDKIKVEPKAEEKKDPTEHLESLKHLTVKRVKIENNYVHQDSNDDENENVKMRKKGLPAKAKKESAKNISRAQQKPNKSSSKTKKSVAASVTKKPLRAVKQEIIQVEIEKVNKTDVKTPILCDLCGATFCTTMKLNHHNKKVHSEKKYKCTQCPTNCTSARDLEAHILRKHEKVRNYICDQCGKGFTSNRVLVSHIKVVHKNIKRIKGVILYKCKFCDRSYKYKRGVTIHERSAHTGERPSVCSVCGSSFYDEVYLAEHMRLHTGATPHKCPVCGRGYAQRGNMKSHMRNHKISELDAETLSKVKPSYHKFMRP